MLPQILKRLFPSRHAGRKRPTPEHPPGREPGAEAARARSGEEALENTIEARKQNQPHTPDR